MRHIDRCLSCLSCMTTCPSGVNYMHLVDHARSYIERTYRRPWHERAAARGAGAPCCRAHGCCAPPCSARSWRGHSPADSLAPRCSPGGCAPCSRWRRRACRAPARLRRSVHPRRGRAPRPRGVAGRLRPAGARPRRSTRPPSACSPGSASRWSWPRGAGCCGALTHHMGQHARRMASARANIEAWSREIGRRRGWTPIVINASGCGTTVKDYGFMFRTDPDVARAGRNGFRAGRRHQRVPDPHRLPADAPGARPDGGLPFRLQPAARPEDHRRAEGAARAAPASPWSSRPSRISAAAPPAPTTCCSRRSPTGCARASSATCTPPRPDLIAAGNIGCITQLAGGGVPVVHTVAVARLDGRRARAGRGRGVPQELRAAA